MWPFSDSCWCFLSIWWTVFDETHQCISLVWIHIGHAMCSCTHSYPSFTSKQPRTGLANPAHTESMETFWHGLVFYVDPMNSICWNISGSVLYGSMLDMWCVAGLIWILLTSKTYKRVQNWPSTHWEKGHFQTVADAFCQSDGLYLLKLISISLVWIHIWRVMCGCTRLDPSLVSTPTQNCSVDLSILIIQSHWSREKVTYFICENIQIKPQFELESHLHNSSDFFECHLNWYRDQYGPVEEMDAHCWPSPTQAAQPSTITFINQLEVKLCPKWTWDRINHSIPALQIVC
jgi:hypothetical protein